MSLDCHPPCERAVDLPISFTHVKPSSQCKRGTRACPAENAEENALLQYSDTITYCRRTHPLTKLSMVHDPCCVRIHTCVRYHARMSDTATGSPKGAPDGILILINCICNRGSGCGGRGGVGEGVERGTGVRVARTAVNRKLVAKHVTGC